MKKKKKLSLINKFLSEKKILLLISATSDAVLMTHVENNCFPYMSCKIPQKKKSILFSSAKESRENHEHSLKEKISNFLHFSFLRRCSSIFLYCSFFTYFPERQYYEFQSQIFEDSMST